MPSSSLVRPELLAPAGDLDCARAAVENGADAIYFGLQSGLNARVRAANFPLENVAELMALLHRRGVRGYVTLNTLVFTDELAEAERTVRAVIAAGVDAVLVQDLGLARLIRAISPDFPLHASTQMTLSSAEAIAVVEHLGIERVVLPRELSVKEIRAVRQRTQVGLEAFVHGALCVAYGGQCLTSESLGGRSANRGHCAQACRLPYELISDGKPVDLGDMRYLLSPQDLAAYSLVPELIDAGVGALKIEGRLKSADYVASITRHYRQAIDTALAGRPVAFTPAEVEEMELTFSRGFSLGWLGGHDPKTLVPATSSSKRGILAGTVRQARRGRVLVELQRRLRRGDGVVFEEPRPATLADEPKPQGGRVFEIFLHGQPVQEADAGALVELAFGRAAVDLTRITPGQALWKTDDPQVTARLRKTYASADPQRRVPLDLVIWAEVGKRLVVEARAASGAACRVESAEPLARAEKHPLTADVLRQQLGRLGGSVYELRELEAHVSGAPMAPLSVLGKLRHALVEQLDTAAQAANRWTCSPENVLPAMLARATASAASGEGEPRLHLLCRSLRQLETVLACGERRLIADFQDIREYDQALGRARQAGAHLLLATTRIEKPGEAGIVKYLLKLRPDGLLARHLPAARRAAQAGMPYVADYSLNATNPLTLELLRNFGAERVTASYDLNREQLLDLVAAAPPAWLEVVIHQHMPMFHMEHCVFCSVLSPGTDKTNCGRPCDRHEVRLRDRVGMQHVLRADVGCRNTLYNATPQSAAEAVPSLLAAGVRDFRVELVHDLSERETAELVGLYRGLLAGQLPGKEVWRRLQAANRVGVTRGTLETKRDPLAIL